MQPGCAGAVGLEVVLVDVFPDFFAGDTDGAQGGVLPVSGEEPW